MTRPWLVTGCRGQLGSALEALLRDAGVPCAGVAHAELDIADAARCARCSRRGGQRACSTPRASPTSTAASASPRPPCAATPKARRLAEACRDAGDPARPRLDRLRVRGAGTAAVSRGRSAGAALGLRAHQARRRARGARRRSPDSWSSAPAGSSARRNFVAAILDQAARRRSGELVRTAARRGRPARAPDLRRRPRCGPLAAGRSRAPASTIWPTRARRPGGTWPALPRRGGVSRSRDTEDLDGRSEGRCAATCLVRPRYREGRIRKVSSLRPHRDAVKAYLHRRRLRCGDPLGGTSLSANRTLRRILVTGRRRVHRLAPVSAPARRGLRGARLRQPAHRPRRERRAAARSRALPVPALRRDQLPARGRASSTRSCTSRRRRRPRTSSACRSRS